MIIIDFLQFISNIYETSFVMRRLNMTPLS